jgi:hypothetical protein
MTDKLQEFRTPVGRLVQGSFYEGSSTDMLGNPRTFKTGKNAGKPRIEYYVALAIPKLPTDNGHWANTTWGAIVWTVGHAAFPNGQASSPNFAWKIVDGDSTIPNTKGTRPCDCEGFPGHWILRLNGSQAPSIFNEKMQPIADKYFVNLGDYVEMYISVSGNDTQGKQTNPGVFLNHKFVCFRGYGDRIITGVKPEDVGFGQAPLPPGASKTPLGSGTAVNSPTPTVPPATMPVVPPYPQILTPAPGMAVPPVPHAPPPVVTAPVRRMTALAAGQPYESFINIGWNDTQLIQHGYMEV